MPDFKNEAPTFVGVLFFNATCYPTREDEQGVLKIADTRYFALRGEPTTKHSGWRCPRRHAITLMAPRRQVAGFQKRRNHNQVVVAFFFCNLLSDKGGRGRQLIGQRIPAVRGARDEQTQKERRLRCPSGAVISRTHREKAVAGFQKKQ